MTKVKLGDRVKMIKKCDNAHVGEEGVVIGILKSDYEHAILVMFDSANIAKHDGSNIASCDFKETIKPYPDYVKRTNRCQFVHFDDVKVIEKLCKLIITMDGSKVAAKLLDGKRTVATGIAKCSPSDTFNFLVGAQLAMQRCIAKQNTEPLVIDIEAAKALGIKFNP